MNETNDTYNAKKSYEGFPYISVFSKQVQDELDRRSSVDFRKTHSMIPWVKITSGLKNITTKDSHADFKVLSPLYCDSSNGHYNFKFTELYPTLLGEEKNKINAFQPLPGVESLNVSYKNDYGGTRVAQFKWKVFTLDQFEEISPYFLTPGIGILLEWGNDSDISGNIPMTLDEYNEISGKNFYNSWKYIRNRSLSLNCRYDAMTGIISNFEYSLNEEGGFDCTTHVISSGALMYSLDTLTPHVNKGATNSNNDKNKPIRKIVDYVSSEQLEKDIKNWSENNSFDADVQIYVDKNNQNKTSYFVTWGFIEDFIVTKNIGIKMIGGEGDDKGTDLFTLKSVGDDEKSLLISNHKYLRTTNLDVCILPQTMEGDTLKGLSFYSDEDTEKTSGKIRNIFVNLDIVKKAFKGTTTLVNALQFILKEINSACLNYWNFSLKIRENNGSMCVIDEKYVDQSMKGTLKDENTKIYNFKIFGGNGILTSLNFDTKMSEGMALVAMYSHHKLPGDNNIVNSNNDAFTFLFGDIKNKYKDQFIEHLELDSETSPDDMVNVSSETSVMIRDMKQNSGYSQTAKKFLPQLEWRDEVGEKNPTSITESDAMERLIFNIKTSNVNSSHAITPADFSLELHGITGIRIGDLFSVDSIPERFKTHSVFQISGVDHTIDDSGWMTTLKAILRVIDPNI